MITRDNLKELIQTIAPHQLQEAINAPGDYILLQAHIYNVGAFATVESSEYSEETEDEANSTGNLFLDKDTFLQLLEETEALEY